MPLASSPREAGKPNVMVWGLGYRGPPGCLGQGADSWLRWVAAFRATPGARKARSPAPFDVASRGRGGARGAGCTGAMECDASPAWWYRTTLLDRRLRLPS